MIIDPCFNHFQPLSMLWNSKIQHTRLRQLWASFSVVNFHKIVSTAFLTNSVVVNHVKFEPTPQVFSLANLRYHNIAKFPLRVHPTIKRGNRHGSTLCIWILQSLGCLSTVGVLCAQPNGCDAPQHHSTTKSFNNIVKSFPHHWEILWNSARYKSY